jgi:crotonobetainyl-CoA:carnitine CoA-transferase CaiB-like acyl-CoA transferase
MGTIATAMLADLGATVIHIENRVTGDSGRGLNKWTLPNGNSSYFEINNRGKKSITIDLTKEKGKQVLYRLVKNSDVFVHNFRQGVPEKLQMDYETLIQYNPKLVYAAASGYGPNGPEASEPLYDFVGLARSGIMNMVGEPELIPQPIYGGVGDQVGGIMTGYGVLVALLVRERLGIGQKVDVSQLGSLMMLQGMAVNSQLILHRDYPLENRKKVNNPLWNYYKCSDGKAIMLANLQPDRQWPDVCKALGIEYLINDPRFNNLKVREENCEEIIRIMDRIFMTKTSAEWMIILKGAGDITCCLVQTIADLENDPQVLANKYIIEYNHAALGPIKVLGSPFQFSKTPAEIKAEAPQFGQHTEEILMEIGGYTWNEITQLKEEEVI